MRHHRAFAALLLTGVLGVSCAAHGGAVDADGVQALLPTQPGGSALALGNSNPNTDKRFGFDYKAAATAAQDGGLRYWSLPATPLTYSSGGKGYTARLHLFASGGQQQATAARKVSAPAGRCWCISCTTSCSMTSAAPTRSGHPLACGAHMGSKEVVR